MIIKCFIYLFYSGLKIAFVPDVYWQFLLFIMMYIAQACSRVWTIQPHTPPPQKFVLDLFSSKKMHPLKRRKNKKKIHLNLMTVVEWHLVQSGIGSSKLP